MSARNETRSSGWRLPAPSRLSRAAFVIYALGIFAATHWPPFTIDVPGVERPDLFIHLAVFATWAVLLNLTGWLGEPRVMRTPLRALPVALVYAAIDESTQALPIIARTAAFDDFLANAAGIALGTIAVLAWGAWASRSTQCPSQPV